MDGKQRGVKSGMRRKRHQEGNSRTVRRVEKPGDQWL